ncbi:MAG: MATE family efflux transporter, partial [Nitrososphaerales archaeon]
MNVLNVTGVNPYGGYELAMTVMWALIIPMLAISQGTNIVVGNLCGERNYLDLKRALFASLSIVPGIMIAVAVKGVLFWNDMSAFFKPKFSHGLLFDADIWWMMIPYIFYGVGSVLKSVFYGTGITKYICCIST